jgi:hypothetical protein
MPGQRRRQRRPLLDVDAHLVDDRRQWPALGLLGQDVERAQQRQARVDHRRELTGQNRDVFELDPVPDERDAQVARHRRLLLRLDVDGHVAHRAELPDEELLAVGLERAFEQLAPAVADLVCERFGHVRPP